MEKWNWSKEQYDTLIQYLKQQQDQKYAAFNKRLITSAQPMIGVRIPVLRKIAKQVAKGKVENYLEQVKYEYYEETLLAGLVIANANFTYDQFIICLHAFIPHIDNWAICDSFCCPFKAVKEHEKEFYHVLQHYVDSKEQFAIRFGIVMLMTLYIKEEYIERVLGILDSIHHEGYYVKMAVAWAVAECFVKQPIHTTTFLQNNHLDDFTFHKSLQKIIDSYRVTPETKEWIRSLKRKK